MAALVNTLMNLRRLSEAKYSWMSDFCFPRTYMLHGGCSKRLLVRWRTNLWQTNNPAAGRTELHLGTTNVACIEHVVKGAGCSTPTGSVWKTFQDHQQTTRRTNRINRLQYKHLQSRSKNTKKGHFKGQLQGLDNARRSLAGPSPHRHGFRAIPVQARDEVNKVAPGQVQCCDNTAQVGCTAPVFTNRVDGARSIRRVGVTTLHDRGNTVGQTQFVSRMLQKHSQSLLTRMSHTELRTDYTGYINIHTYNWCKYTKLKQGN